MKKIDSAEVKAKVKEETSWRSFQGWFKSFVMAIGVIMVLYHIYAVVIDPVDPWILRSAHVGFACVLTFLLVPATKKSSRTRVSVLDWILIAAGVSISVYVIIELDGIINRVGFAPTSGDIFFGILQIIVLLEAARRITGILLPIFALTFLAYAMFGSVLPGVLGFPDFKYTDMISLIFSEQGIYGVPLYASATLALFFITFGAFLRSTGAGDYLIKFSMAVAGGTRGGPAKVAVLGSGLFGMISGSAAANVATTGTFTIPLMKDSGYKPTFAGAVEAVSSAGGQIMPPLMGTGAFIMAELIGMPYSEIMVQAAIPAVLYYMAVFLMVDLEAYKTGLKGLPRAQLPSLKTTLLEGLHVLVPVGVLLFLLVGLHMSPVYSILWSLVSLIVVCTFQQRTRIGLRGILYALFSGARGTLMIAVACGTAGIIIGALTATGLGIRFATIVLDAAGGNIYLVLFFTMILCIILGMDMPTAPSYIIAAAVAAPVLTGLGVPILAAHLFCFYFAVFSTLTPPVALSAFTAAGIADAPVLPLAMTGLLLGSAAFIVPYAFVLGPALLLIGDTWHVIGAVITSVIGILALALSIQYPRLNLIQRGLLFVSALGMIVPGFSSDVFGITAFALAGIIQKVKGLRSKSARLASIERSKEASQ